MQFQRLRPVGFVKCRFQLSSADLRVRLSSTGKLDSSEERKVGEFTDLFYPFLVAFYLYTINYQGKKSTAVNRTIRHFKRQETSRLKNHIFTVSNFLCLWKVQIYIAFIAAHIAIRRRPENRMVF